MAERSVTPRGFAIYGYLDDTRGSRIRVQESSDALRDCVWIFAEHPGPRLRPGYLRRLAMAGLATEEQLAELAVMLTPAAHLNVEQATQVRDAFIAGHSPASVALPDDVSRLWDAISPDGGRAAGMARNALARNGVAKVGDLTAMTEADLMGLRNFGPGCLAEVRRVLAVHGLALRGEEVPGGQ